MTNFTKSQVKALEWGFKADGALRAPGTRMGGAYRRCCERLVDQGLLGETPPMGITIKGLVALRDVWARRWADHGCMAYKDALDSVEAALAEFPHAAARFGGWARAAPAAIDLAVRDYDAALKTRIDEK